MLVDAKLVDPNIEEENKKKTLDPSNEEVINTLPINGDQSSPKLGSATITDHKIYG